MNKSEQRKFFLEKRKQISFDGAQQKSRKICEMLMHHKKFRSAKTIAFFSAITGEVDLESLFEVCCAEKKCVFPKVQNSEKREMNFFWVQKKEDLIAGFCGILEPKNDCIPVEISDIDLFLVPAVAVDFSKNRLGMGMGFYDNAFLHNTNAFRLAVLFAECLTEKIETEQHDIKMDEVISF